MALAALRPRPMASVTVPSRLVTSPPAQTPSSLVAPVASSTVIQPFSSLKASRPSNCGALADGRQDHVAVDDELGAFNRLGTPAAAVVRLAKLHLDALEAGDLAAVAYDLDRSGQVLDVDALFEGIVDLFLFSRHLLAGTPVDDLRSRRPSSRRRGRRRRRCYRRR